MNRIPLLKCTKLTVLIWMTTCKTEINSLELSCNITTFQTHLKKTQDDAKSITAVNKCAKDYHDADIINKCEYFVNSNKSENISSLFKPVTNRFKNIIYWNEFCAICNNETELEYWATWTTLQNLSFICTMRELEVEMGSAANDLHRITRNLTRNGLKLISKSMNSAELQCSVDEIWPFNLLHFLVPCLTDQFRKSQDKKFYSCYFENKEGVCSGISVIIEGIDFKVDKNNVAFFDPSEHPNVDESGFAYESGLDNVYYLCDYRYTVRGKNFYWIDIFVSILSIICIVIYLFLNFTEQYLQSFPNRIIFSYAIGLLISYLLATTIYLLIPLSITVYNLSYSFYFSWTIIMSFEFSRLIYSTLRKRKVTVNFQFKTYLIYCFVGYVTPTALFVIYFLLLESNEKQCPQLPNNFGVLAGPLENSVAWYFTEYWHYIMFDTILSIILPIWFVLQAVALIYITKCSPTHIRSTVNRSYTIVLMKMACIMGAQWMMNTFFRAISDYIASNIFLICALLIDLQGVFVFFVFGFKKNWINGILFKCGFKGAQQDISGGTSGTTVQSTSSLQMSELKGTEA